MSRKGKGGRPTDMTKDTINKLEQAFAVGATDREACFLAGISTQTLYNYQKKYPEFIDRKQGLKDSQILKARQTVAKGVEENEQTAKWVLERKRPDEFAPQKQINVDVVHKMNDEQLLEAYKQALQQIPGYQEDVIEAEIVTSELMHNPDTDED